MTNINYKHQELAKGRWQNLSLMEQMGNIGSEVGRAIKWNKKQDNDRFISAFDRALELFSLTLADNRWQGRRKEIARSKEVFCDLFFGGNQFGTVPESLAKYFMQYAIAARIRNNMNIKPIKTKKDYQQALKRVDKLWGSKTKSEQNELDILATLLDVYESEQFPIFPPDPIDAIIFRMEQEGIKKSELAVLVGGKNRVSEILNRKRKLTVKMIRKLSQGLNIPAQVLIGS